MIDFEWYRSFISIYKHRSVSAAAKARILTQPAMSQHLAALEAEVGEPLFVRAPRSMIPTEKGKELYAKLIPLIENLEHMTTQIRYDKSHQSAKTALRIGSPHEYFMKRAIGCISRLEYRFTVRLGVAQQLLEWLQQDELDVIVTPQRIQLPGIDYDKLEEETFVLTVPAGYAAGNGAPDAANMKAIEAWLSEQPWISYGFELPIIRRFWKTHFRRRPAFQAVHVIPDLRMIQEAITNHMGISLLPKYLIDDAVAIGSCDILYPQMAVSNELFLACKTSQNDHPAYKKIYRALSRA